MHTKKFVFCALVLFISGQTHPYILNRNVNKSECENICTGIGQTEFDGESKICKCLLSKHLDDVDLGLVNKKALLFGKSANQIERLKEDKKIVKRDVSGVSSTAASPTTPEEQPSPKPSVTETTTSSGVESESTIETDLNLEIIVGQGNPNKRRNQRPTPRRARDPRPITLEQQRIILQQINEHLNRLNQLSDHRLREYEIEAIRNGLRQLSHTVLLLEQRSRIRNIVEERRKIVKPKLLHSKIVAAPYPNFLENPTEKPGFHDKKHKLFDIITQDPRLIDE